MVINFPLTKQAYRHNILPLPCQSFFLSHLVNQPHCHLLNHINASFYCKYNNTQFLNKVYCRKCTYFAENDKKVICSQKSLFTRGIIMENKTLVHRFESHKSPRTSLLFQLYFLFLFHVHLYPESL